MHLDKHVVKMPIELCQMLVTARVMKGDLPEDTKYYTYRMRNHPCSVWVRKDLYGFQYTEELLRALCDEYWHRFGRHKEHRHASGVHNPGLKHNEVLRKLDSFNYQLQSDIMNTFATKKYE